MDEDSRSHSQSEGGGERSILSDFTPPRSSTVRAQLIQPPNDFRVSNSDAGPGVYSGAKYKLMSPGKLPISRSPCITIPPGLSPTSFLESPVLLSNIKPEPSPTTGSFFNTKLMPVSGGTSGFSFATNISNNNVDERKSTGFEFKFQVECNSASGVPLEEGPAAISGFKGQESKLLDQVQNQCQSQSLGSASLVKCQNAATSKDLRPDMFTSGASASVPVEVDTDELNQKGSAVPGVQVSESDHKDTGSSVIAEKSSDDGYNWRKYGQKLVKGSEFPRSYYKCTYPNCEVKKIFERSHDGQITEIVYKGTHDHPKPQPSRRFNAGALMSIQQEQTDKVSCFTGQEDNTAINVQAYNMDPSGGSGMSPRQANDDSINGTASHLNNVNDDGDEDDPISKRRKLEAGCINVMPVVKPIREPRVVVQTMSEIDILDDGYRWRKYGQKVVRGNPNPRSYYKCTNAGCPVRKHVERASHDPKAVITTYEGKHNHDVPIGRTNSHDMAGPMVNGMPRIQSEENETVSLNLGVGINYDSDNRTYGPVDSEFVQNQNPVTSSNIKVAQASTVSLCYGVVNGGMNLYGSRENHVDTPPLRHSSHQYPQSHGRVLLGP